MVFEVIYRFGVGRNKTSQAREGLAEGSHNEVNLVGQSEVTRSAGTMFTQNANRMRVVHHYGRVVLPGYPAQFWKLDNVAFHAKNAIHDDELTGGGIDALETILQCVHIAVIEAKKLTRRAKTALDDTGVVALVTQHEIALTHER